MEGLDGCGKTTQAKLLSDWFKKEKGREVFLTAEPTQGEIGKFIRKILSGSHEVDPKTLALLFTADRYEHLKNEVLPALKEGKVVISERYYYSTIAYQLAQGVEKNFLLEINKFARKPDVTIFLDIEPKVGVSRTKTQEIFERVDFLEKVRENYLKFQDNFVKIDGSQSKEKVFSEIKKNVEARGI